MIRLIQNRPFKINNDIITFYENNNKETSEEDTKYLKDKSALESYKDFIKEIKNLEDGMLPGFIIVENDIEENTLYIFRRLAFESQFKLLFKYKPENDDMYEYIKSLFRFNDIKSSTLFEFSGYNNFSIITNSDVLDLILSKKFLESNGEEPYTTFKKKSKNGKIRDITAPHPEIKRCLRNLNETLQKIYDKRNIGFQIAYKKGKNVKSGAILHVDHNYVFNMDLKDFYPSCKKEIVKKYTDFLFANSFNRSFIEDEFFEVILRNDGLFIGSPISGTLANAVISSSVKYLDNICKKYDMTLSVYADDITFSSNKFISKKFVYSMFNNAFAKYGLDSYFNLNEKKSIGFSGCNRKVTGISINNSNKVTIPRRYYRDLRVMISHLDQGKPMNIGVLRGKIAYAVYIDDTGKVLNYLKKFKNTIEKYNLYSGTL